MGRDLWENSTAVKTIVEQASESTGLNLKDLLWNATDEDLKNTDKAQIAITTVNLAAAAVLKEQGVHCEGVAGFSLGEYAALQLAGVFSVEELFAIVKARGDAMAEASNALRTDAGQPGMAAVLGLDYEKMVQLCEARLTDVYIANYNSPNQIVISATADGLAQAETVCKEAG
ncbi:MAG TPA: ACP S-malonyltransferase, partial [Spirochaetia bacterium]|nr:ACP S-malonyltransferase [Spirochaetia bacterium]